MKAFYHREILGGILILHQIVEVNQSHEWIARVVPSRVWVHGQAFVAPSDYKLLWNTNISLLVRCLLELLICKLLGLQRRTIWIY